MDEVLVALLVLGRTIGMCIEDASGRKTMGCDC